MKSKTALRPAHRVLTCVVMTLGETLVSVWQQALVEARSSVELGEARFGVTKTSRTHLVTVRFAHGPHRIDGIEQNPQTGSRWAARARAGKRIMQFSCQGRYIGNVCEGQLQRYAAWQGLALPE